VATGEWLVGFPVLFRVLTDWIIGPLPAGKAIELHPVAYAGWVGIFVTALNLVPIGQLDGGHVLYALLRRKAHLVASVLMWAALVAMFLTQSFQYFFMLLLIVMIGPMHPPTGDDDVPLGTGRVILGWLTLSFIIIGFTPTPFGVR
jgi:membrane-associated protease RseP (regulator of RpoE activity)